jgi:hypothetical protein
MPNVQVLLLLLAVFTGKPSNLRHEWRPAKGLIDCRKALTA